MRSYLEPQNLFKITGWLWFCGKSQHLPSLPRVVFAGGIMIWNCVELRLIGWHPHKTYCYNASSVGILPPKCFENSGIQMWFAQMLWGCSFVKLTLLDWPRWSCCWLLSTQITLDGYVKFFLHPECLKKYSKVPASTWAFRKWCIHWWYSTVCTSNQFISFNQFLMFLAWFVLAKLLQFLQNGCMNNCSVPIRIRLWNSSCWNVFPWICISSLRVSCSSCNGKLQTFSSSFRKNSQKDLEALRKSRLQHIPQTKRKVVAFCSTPVFVCLLKHEKTTKRKSLFEAPVQLWDDSGSGGKPAPLGIAKSDVMCATWMRGWDSSSFVWF